MTFVDRSVRWRWRRYQSCILLLYLFFSLVRYLWEWGRLVFTSIEVTHRTLLVGETVPLIECFCYYFAIPRTGGDDDRRHSLLLFAVAGHGLRRPTLTICSCFFFFFVVTAPPVFSYRFSVSHNNSTSLSINQNYNTITCDRWLTPFCSEMVGLKTDVLCSAVWLIFCFWLLRHENAFLVQNGATNKT